MTAVINRGGPSRPTGPKRPPPESAAISGPLGRWSIRRKPNYCRWARRRWLRRQRRVAGPPALRAAKESFDALGFDGLAEIARQELRASREPSIRRTPDARDRLTPHELQIAQMAAQGTSNHEIGQQLYISHRFRSRGRVARCRDALGSGDPRRLRREPACAQTRRRLRPLQACLIQIG